MKKWGDNPCDIRDYRVFSSLTAGQVDATNGCNAATAVIAPVPANWC